MVSWTHHLAEQATVGAIRRRQLSAKRAFRDAKASARRQGFLEAVELAKKLDVVDDSGVALLVAELDQKGKKQHSATAAAASRTEE